MEIGLFFSSARGASYCVRFCVIDCKIVRIIKRGGKRERKERGMVMTDEKGRKGWSMWGEGSPKPWILR